MRCFDLSVQQMNLGLPSMLQTSDCSVSLCTVYMPHRTCCNYAFQQASIQSIKKTLQSYRLGTDFSSPDPTGRLAANCIGGLDRGLIGLGGVKATGSRLITRLTCGTVGSNGYQKNAITIANTRVF